jgi:hypothetical protein
VFALCVLCLLRELSFALLGLLPPDEHPIAIIIIQFFIIYVPNQQPQGQLQAQHSVDKNNYFMNGHNIKSKTS